VAPPRLTRGRLNAILLVVAAAWLVAAVRPRLFDADRTVRERHDVYFLPPPKQVATMSLGYRSAVADVLWAHVLVSQGLHTIERRRFDNLSRLYDVINELAPTWRTPYLYVDALFSFQAGGDRYEDAKKARAILERGAENRPLDAELWLNLGQYVAFIAAPSYIQDHHPEEAEQWRLDGARALARAAELAGDQSWIAWQAIGGTSILRKAGEQEASIRFLERALAVTEDEELREDLLLRLRQLAGEKLFVEQQQRARAFHQEVDDHLPFLTRAAALVVGPFPAPNRCAGPGHDLEPSCATSWRQWAERQQRAAREAAAGQADDGAR
jgi:tetratricopeptide (TPR) repeat protein